VDQMLLKMRVH